MKQYFKELYIFNLKMRVKLCVVIVHQNGPKVLCIHDLLNMQSVHDLVNMSINKIV